MRLNRASRRAELTALALIAVGLPCAAQAYDLEDESERSTYFEVRLGPFRPNIDSQFSGDKSVRPYQRIFNDETSTMVSVALERHLLKDVGTLSLGFGIGYWSVEGTGISDGAEDKTELNAVPMQLQLSYRLDIWQEIVPLVPMVRAGLDYVWWEMLDGEGNTSKFAPGVSAEGGTWGYHLNFGVLLALDFFDPEMAADFDRDAGVNASYLLFEVQYSQVDDFGGKGSLRFGNTTFFGGLALDF